MHRYMVNPTNPDDQKDACPHSYTSGRHGFTVRAPDMAGALAAAVERARAEGIYGRDWAARVRRLDARGAMSKVIDFAHWPETEAYVALRDDAGPWATHPWGEGETLGMRLP